MVNYSLDKKRAYIFINRKALGSIRLIVCVCLFVSFNHYKLQEFGIRVAYAD